VATVFQRINELADARKREKQASYEPLISRTYRQNEKSTSQYSDTNHQTPVDPDAMFSGKVQESLATRTTEHEALKVAGGLSAYEEQPPLIDIPNKFADKRPCTCATHKGNRWQPLANFSERRAKNGKLYPASWCKRCKADYAADIYYKHKQANGF
jgi:hypothetical protein